MMTNYFPQLYNTSLPYAYGAPASTGAVNTSTYGQDQLNSINWVQGEAGARSVPVPPNQKTLLMDSETNVFYIKSSDASGMPLPLRTFEYKEISGPSTTEKPDGGAPSTYVTHEELEQKISELKQKPKEEKKSNDFLI